MHSDQLVYAYRQVLLLQPNRIIKRPELIRLKMTPEQVKQYRQAAADGSLPEEENPLNLFAKTGTSLLVKMLNKEFNIFNLIKMNLRERGVDDKGRWVGFATAKKGK